MMKPLLLLYLILSLTIPIISTPFLLGTTLFLLALILTLMLLLLSSSWAAMILFIIFISGTLIMFAYFLSIQPNHPQNISPLILSLLTNTLSALFLSPQLPTLTNTPSVSLVLSLQSTPTLILLTLVLLLALITVVYLTQKSGTLRPFQNK